MFEALAPRGRGVGTQVFVVRGVRALSLSSAAELRPRYNEYPERYAFEPDFPQAGRRGGSRAPSVTGAGVGVTGAAAGARIIGAGGSIFPGQRERGDLPGLQISGQMPPAGAGQYSDICPPPQGEVLGFGRNINAAQSPFTETSQLIPYPFVIVHMMWISNLPTTDNPAVNFFIDDLVDAGTSRAGTGVSLVSPFSRGTRLSSPSGLGFESYINRKVSERNQVIGVEYRTTSAGGGNFDVIVDIQPL